MTRWGFGVTAYSVISIGAMAANPLWGERSPVRTGHATTTLIISGDSRILVDPGLPAPALVARLEERARLAPGDITDVFLTSFLPDARRALPAFEDAKWWISESEREAVGVPMAAQLKRLSGEGGDEDGSLGDLLRQDVALLQRCRPAPQSLARGVDLYPMPGVTPGLCGLLIADARFTTLVCGDAIPTREHLEQGKVPQGAADIEKARESFAEALEVADLLVLGRDNVAVNPTKRPF